MMLRSVLLPVCLIGVASVLAGCVVYEPPPGQPVIRPMPPPPPPPPPRPISVQVGFFYDALDPDGDWLWIDPYGWVWAPNAVAPFWRPYTVGHWEWTDWGWTWVSSERWGWATYHYGRWMRVDHHGWVWVPGEVWGPAWVAWRDGPGVIGWAPLPPEVRFRAEIGLDWGGVDVDVAIRLDHWCFVDDVRFADNDVYRYAYPVGRNTTAIRGTRNATRVRVAGGKILNEGIDRGELERKTRRAVPVRRIVDDPRTDRRTTEVTTDEVRTFRPEFRPGPPDVAPPRGRKPAEPARPPSDPKVEIDAEKRWDRGWNKDWDRLVKLQKRGEPVVARPAPAATPAVPAPVQRRPEPLERVRDENMDAADNAYRELQAERERAKRQAERGPAKVAPQKDPLKTEAPRKAAPKKEDKSGEKQDP